MPVKVQHERRRDIVADGVPRGQVKREESLNLEVIQYSMEVALTTFCFESTFPSNLAVIGVIHHDGGAMGLPRLRLVWDTSPACRRDFSLDYNNAQHQK